MPFNNTYTLMVGQDLIDEGVRSIDDLAVYMNANDAPLSICVEGEFYSRPDGLDGLQALYGFAFQEEKIQVMETSETYSKLRDGDCDVAEGFATDGRISAWNFTNLQDSLAFFPFYNPTPVVRKEVLDLHPEIAVLLNNLSRLIDEPTMSELNARVDIGADGILGNGDEESVEDVAYSFLRANRLIALPEIAVSVIDADEGFHALLGEMLTLVLDDAGYQVVDKTDLGSSSIVRQAMLDGEVDLYLESVVTALSEYQNLPISALPTTKERAYLLAQTLDQANDIVWLDLMPYEETYAIIVADALDDEEITSLDDFALYMNANDSPLTICMNNEFYGSKLNGLSSLEALYGFNFQPDNILLMETEAIFDALDAGDCDVAAASTDAADRGYTVLDDPLEFFLSFGSAPVVRQEILDQNPELAVLLNNLVARLDAETVGQLDRQVELGADGEESSGDELDAYTVALDFLVDAGLIEPPAEDASDSGTDEGAADDSSTSQETPPSIGDEQPVVPSPADDGSDTGSGSVTPEAPALTQRSPQTTGVTSRPIVPTVAIASSAGARPSAVTKDLNATIDVGSMADTEQRLMGAMLVAMLRDAGYPVVDRTASGTSPDLRAMLEAGEIDIYPEFTGVALSLYHNIPPSALPTTAEGAFSLIQRLDTAFNIAWIRKASFDSAYGLAVSAQLAGEGFRTLFDLAEAVRVSQRSLTICADEEFANDEELGLPSVATIYDIELNPATITILPSE
ncbi:MAG: glycine betaine ABC transporter substrate-binding protein, partial [Caldilineaceae bacterium]